MSRTRNDPPLLRPPLPQLPATPRWAPSTPHAIRALQQRSGGGRRKSGHINRPDSARNILRRLAKIRAQENKRRSSTPVVEPSTPENRGSFHRLSAVARDDGLEDDKVPQRPDFTLPIGEEEEGEGEGEDEAVVGHLPTRRELSDGEEYTFTSIDFAARNAKSPTSVQSERVRRISRLSTVSSPGRGVGAGESDGDDTVQSVEFGRRAVSEGPAWDRYPRSSFGSIRMSEFGLDENRLQKDTEEEASLMLGKHHELDMDAVIGDDVHPDLGGDTEDLSHLHQSASQLVDSELFVHENGLAQDSDSSRIEFRSADHRSEVGGAEIQIKDASPPKTVDDVDVVSPSPSRQSSLTRSQSPQPAISETADLDEPKPTSAPVPRRKRLKLTKNGNEVPSLPCSLIKKVAIDSVTRTGKKRPVIHRESLAALEQATEWFFEQVGEDLDAYSSHGKRRKRIDDADVVTLMKRQRMIGRERGLMDLAGKFLPDDVLCNL